MEEKEIGSLEQYFKNLKDYELFTVQEERVFATALIDVKNEIIIILHTTGAIKKLLASEIKMEEIFNISQTDTNKNKKKRNIKNQVLTVSRLSKLKSKQKIVKLPFRWEVLEQLTLYYLVYGKDRKKKLELINLQRQAKEIKDKFVNANLRLVIDMVRRINSNPFGALPWQDLIQEGNLGLIKAVDKYDPSKGFRFSTYACWWIIQSIIRAMADKGRLIRFPVHVQTREARQTNQTPQQILCPFDANISNSGEDDIKLSDIIADDKYTDEPFLNAEINTVILKSLTKFHPREEKIMRMYFGLDGKVYTLEQIGEVFGITRERVRQIKVRILKDLKENQELRILFEGLDDHPNDNFTYQEVLHQ